MMNIADKHSTKQNMVTDVMKDVAIPGFDHFLTLFHHLWFVIKHCEIPNFSVPDAQTINVDQLQTRDWLKEKDMGIQ